MLDERSKSLLKTLVERYIADGQPVGSRTLSKASGLELSPATIRNVMADLEELGLIASPHTSAGRVPTARGYRLFVDTMLTAQPGLIGVETAQLQPDQPQRVIASAAQMLSNLSSFVGVVTAPKKPSVFHHIEFLRLGERRVLVILVSPDGDVQNRVIFTAQDLTQSELAEASNRLNAGYAGLTLEAVRERLRLEVDALRGEIAGINAVKTALALGDRLVAIHVKDGIKPESNPFAPGAPKFSSSSLDQRHAGQGEVPTVEAMKAGASDYLVKGKVDPDQLERTLLAMAEGVAARLRDAGLRADAEQFRRVGSNHVSWALALHRTGQPQRAAEMVNRMIASQLKRAVSNHSALASSACACKARDTSLPEAIKTAWALFFNPTSEGSANT